MALLDSMAEHGLAPNAVTFTVAISACGKGGQPQTALSLLEAMEARGLPRSVHAYTAAVSALERSGDAAGALALMDEMEKKGVSTHAVVEDDACCVFDSFANKLSFSMVLDLYLVHTLPLIHLPSFFFLHNYHRCLRTPTLLPLPSPRAELGRCTARARPLPVGRKPCKCST